MFSFKKFNFNLFLQSRNIVLGRATSLSTKYYLEQSKIPFIHTLKISNLNIHPFIINTPLHQQTNKENINQLYIGTILKYSFNCFYVYSRNNNNKWYTTCVTNLIEQGIDREGLVTIANLGKIKNKDELMEVLDDAWTVTDQEFIDIVTLEVSY